MRGDCEGLGNPGVLIWEVWEWSVLPGCSTQAQGEGEGLRGRKEGFRSGDGGSGWGGSEGGPTTILDVVQAVKHEAQIGEGSWQVPGRWRVLVLYWLEYDTHGGPGSSSGDPCGAHWGGPWEQGGGVREGERSQYCCGCSLGSGA